MKITFDQIIALVLIGVATGLMISGIDGEVKAILSVAAGWAFGSGYQVRRKKIERLSPEEFELIIKRLEADGFGKGTD